MKVVIEPHDPGWAGKFDRESQFVARALEPTVLAIHHIGSASIPRFTRNRSSRCLSRLPPGTLALLDESAWTLEHFL